MDPISKKTIEEVAACEEWSRKKRLAKLTKDRLLSAVADHSREGHISVDKCIEFITEGMSSEQLVQCLEILDYNKGR